MNADAKIEAERARRQRETELAKIDVQMRDQS
jgi:hypothetical protein